MSIFKKHKKYSQDNSLPLSPVTSRTLKSYGMLHPLDNQDTYNNVFTYIDTIANKFATITPYAENMNGVKLIQQPAAIQALYNPNDMFSFREFLKYIASAILCRPYVDILVWTETSDGRIHPGGPVTENNIIGYTFLPTSARIQQGNGNYIFQSNISINGETSHVETFTRDDVISLRYSVQPDHLLDGISPAMTVETWSTIDTLISEYERGFFKNGAVPAGIMDIIADDPESFRRTVDDLKNGYQGADKTNGVLYNFRPVDPITMEPKQYSKFEWHALQSGNDKLDLSTLNSVSHDHLAGAFGVPDMARGLDNGQTYANAEQANISYLENTIRPLCETVWNKFESELKRITRGGLNYRINFKIVLPQQTDVINVQAQTLKTLTDAYTELVNIGADPNKAAEALNLTQFTDIMNNSSTTSPVQAKNTYSKQPHKVTRSETYRRIRRAARSYYQTISQKTQNPGYSETTDTDLKKFTQQLLDCITPYVLQVMNANGLTLSDLVEAEADPQYLESKRKELASLINNSVLSGAYYSTLLKHVTTVSQQTTNTVTADINKIMMKAKEEDWTKTELANTLNDYINQHADLLARTETTTAQSMGTIYEGTEWNNHIKYKALKKWVCYGSNPCETCRQLDGITITVEESFKNKKAATLEQLTVEPAEIECPAHANCQCGLILVISTEE